MLRSLTLSNFKPYDQGPHTLPLAPITLLYGPNSSGKSSIFQALLMMKQTFAATGNPLPRDLHPRGEHFDLASFRSFVHRQLPDNTFRFGVNTLEGDQLLSDPVGLTLSYAEAPASPDGQCEEVKVNIRPSPDMPLPPLTLTPLVSSKFTTLSNIPFSANKPTSNWFTLENNNPDELFRLFKGMNRWIIPSFPADDAILAILTKVLCLGEWEPVELPEEESDKLRKAPVEPSLPIFTLDTSDPDGFLNSAPLEWASMKKAGLSPDQALPAEIDDRIKLCLSAVVNLIRSHVGYRLERLRDHLETIEYIGAFREPPQRIYADVPLYASSVGSRGENARLLLRGNLELMDRVNKALERIHLPYTISYCTESVRLIGAVGYFELRRAGDLLETPITLADVGFGVSQVLPVIVGLLEEGPRILCIEEPEIHLHPKLQAELANLFVRFLELGLPGETRQLIVETHSENILLRIQKLIRKKELSPEMVSIVYVDNDESGKAKLTSIGLDANGRFTAIWPRGFFEERFEEIYDDV